jgi:hypothetical protein
MADAEINTLGGLSNSDKFLQSDFVCFTLLSKIFFFLVLLHNPNTLSPLRLITASKLPFKRDCKVSEGCKGILFAISYLNCNDLLLLLLLLRSLDTLYPPVVRKGIRADPMNPFEPEIRIF